MRPVDIARDSRKPRVDYGADAGDRHRSLGYVRREYHAALLGETEIRITWNGEEIENYSVEIADCYLDEFLSKFEPELWASIETLAEKIFG